MGIHGPYGKRWHQAGRGEIPGQAARNMWGLDRRAHPHVEGKGKRPRLERAFLDTACRQTGARAQKVIDCARLRKSQTASESPSAARSTTRRAASRAGGGKSQADRSERCAGARLHRIQRPDPAKTTTRAARGAAARQAAGSARRLPKLLAHIQHAICACCMAALRCGLLCERSIRISSTQRLVHETVHRPAAENRAPRRLPLRWRTEFRKPLLLPGFSGLGDGTFLLPGVVALFFGWPVAPRGRDRPGPASGTKLGAAGAECRGGRSARTRQPVAQRDDVFDVHRLAHHGPDRRREREQLALGV